MTHISFLKKQNKNPFIVWNAELDDSVGMSTNVQKRHLDIDYINYTKCSCSVVYAFSFSIQHIGSK